MQLLRAGGRPAPRAELLRRPRLPQPDRLPVHAGRRPRAARQVPAGAGAAVHADGAARRGHRPAAAVGDETGAGRGAHEVLPAQRVRPAHGGARRRQIRPADADQRFRRRRVLEPAARTGVPLNYQFNLFCLIYLVHLFYLFVLI